VAGRRETGFRREPREHKKSLPFDNFVDFVINTECVAHDPRAGYESFLRIATHNYALEQNPYTHA
jgi:hypothetical protein